MDWPEVLKALGVFLSGVITALGLWAFRLIPVRAKATIDTREADARIEKDKQTAARKAQKDALDEYRDVVEMLRGDVADWRKQVHDVRGENSALATKAAVQDFQIKQLAARVDECETDRREMREMLEACAEAMRAAGIPVPRRGPVQLHGPEQVT